MGAPCDISIVALPAFIHPPFPSTIPPSFPCLESLFVYTHGFCRSTFSSDTVAARRPVGDSVCPWVWGGPGCWVSLSPSCRRGPQGWHTWFGQQQHRSRAGQGAGQRCHAPGVGSQVCAPLLPWRWMRQAAQRYSCPASDQCLFSRLKGSL